MQSLTVPCFNPSYHAALVHPPMSATAVLHNKRENMDLVDIHGLLMLGFGISVFCHAVFWCCILYWHKIGPNA